MWALLGPYKGPSGPKGPHRTRRRWLGNGGKFNYFLDVNLDEYEWLFGMLMNILVVGIGRI